MTTASFSPGSPTGSKPRWSARPPPRTSPFRYGLACSLVPQRHRRAGGDGQVEAVDGGTVALPVGQLTRLDGEIAGHPGDLGLRVLPVRRMPSSPRSSSTRGHAYAEHLPADVPEQSSHEDSADSREAGVLVGEAGAAGVGFEPVGDQRHLATSFPSAHEYRSSRGSSTSSTSQSTMPFQPSLGLATSRTSSYDGGEAFRPAAGAGRGPQRDQGRVGQRPPDLDRGMGIVAHDTDLAHENSSG